MGNGSACAVGLSTAHIWPRGDKTYAVGWCEGGSSVALKTPQGHSRCGGGERGLVQRFTAASRLRLLHKLAAVDKRAVELGRAWFVTLTYPGEYSTDPKVWKRDLQAFRKRMERAWCGLAGFWKLEFQRRGAPHWHLLLVADGGIDPSAFRSWTSEAWYATVGSGDVRHLHAGTQVGKVRGWNQVQAYAGKYLGKTVAEDERVVQEATGGAAVGRFWGVWRYQDLPVVRVVETVSREAWYKVRRCLDRVAGKKGTRVERGVRRFADGLTVARLVDLFRGPSLRMEACRC